MVVLKEERDDVEMVGNFLFPAIFFLIFFLIFSSGP